MSGYHSFELCYLAAIYSNLLVTKQPMDFYFKPIPGGFKDGKLRVAPDLLPDGSIRIGSVTIDGEPYTDFDADNLVVNLPATDKRVTVKVRIEPTSGLDHFVANTEVSADQTVITLSGELDAHAVPHFRSELEKAYSSSKLILDMSDLELLSPQGARALIFARQKMPFDEQVIVVGASGQPKEILDLEEFTEEVRSVAALGDA
jgi:anti-anti-sigma factor